MGPAFRSRLPLLLFAGGVVACVVAINGYVLVDFLRVHLPQVRPCEASTAPSASFQDMLLSQSHEIRYGDFLGVCLPQVRPP